MTPLPDYDARLQAIEAITAVRRGSGDAAQIDAAAEQLAATASLLDKREPVANEYASLSSLFRSLAHLMRWYKALHSAEPDGQRHLTAAKLAARAISAVPNQPSGSPLSQTADSRIKEVVEKIQQVNDVGDVAGIAIHMLSIPVNVPIVVSRQKENRQPSVRKREPTPSAQPRPVAILKLRLNNQEVDGQLTIQRDVLNDLDASITVSRWPNSAARIDLEPLHVELPSTIELSTLSFMRPKSAPEDQPVSAQCRGRLVVRATQDLLARPLTIQFMGLGIDAQGSSSPIQVEGQKSVILHSFDPKLTPRSGFRLVDEALVAIRDEARRSGVPDEELSALIAIVAGTGSIAAQALAGNLYPKRISEKEFQADLKGRLRSIPTIGSELEEHPNVSGGITDLSFHRIRIELKADDNGAVTIDSALASYGQQAAQYVAGSDRRTGLLIVLENNSKTAAPGLVQNDIAFRTLPPQSGGKYPIHLAVIVIRGGLARPSSLSK